MVFGERSADLPDIIATQYTPRGVDQAGESDELPLSPGLSFTVYSQTLCVYAQAYNRQAHKLVVHVQ